MTNLMVSIVNFNSVTLDENGQIVNRIQLSAKCFHERLSKETELTLVLIPGGSFVMGAQLAEEGWHPNQSPVRTVTIAPFWMSQFPITQAQWAAVAALPMVSRRLSANPSCFAGENRPVEQVSWQDAIEFCNRLSATTNRHYRLPSEAEWEYACRAGTETPFHFGPTITTDLANYSGINWEYDGRLCSKGFYGKGPTGCDLRETTEVGSFGVANAFGLYDMHGLVREWCADSWHDSYENAPTQGDVWSANQETTQRVLRGGSWNSGPRTCRAAFRSRANAGTNLYDIGFRVVCESPIELDVAL